MISILVTGPIAGGKSETCRYLMSKGYPVYDCDSRTKLLYKTVPGLKCRIEAALQTDWSHIDIIFSDESKREKLEAIVYPYLLEDIRAWKSEQQANLLFVESAIALDKPIFDEVYDKVLYIGSPLDLRLKRNPKVKERDALQSYDSSKIDFKIDNSLSLTDLYNKIDTFLCRLI